MYNLISNIKFKNHVDSFQKELMNDVKEINSSDGLLVHGDKSNNIYVVPSWSLQIAWRSLQKRSLLLL